jgi:uncharacterized membrane protein
MDDNKIEQLLASETEQIGKLNRIVLQAIEEENLISNKLYEFEEKATSLPNKVADKVAAFGGSWLFILSFLSFMALWILYNASTGDGFDPYPFILLNLILSTIAAIQAPVILMSQNRREVKDRQRAVNDYMVNLKSEIEIRNMHEKLDLLIAEQMKTLFELQQVQVDMMKEIKAGMGSGAK